jgi:hypothetical protein
MTTTLRAVIVAVSIGATANAGPAVRSAAAQQPFKYIGPKQCTNCHDHDAEKLWYEKKEIPEVHRLFPDQNNAGHINSLKQLEAKKSDEYAKAIGLADKYDAGGSCVACHGTVWGGEANAGVSCESCHGPGSGYKDPHQQKDSYEKSVKEFGMTRLVGNFVGWTQQCTNCHVMTDDKLIAAGHPSGDDFDLSKKFVPVSLHFKKMYEAADVAAVAKGEMQAVLRRRGRATAPTATPTATPEAPALPAGATAAAPAAAPTTPAATSAAPTSTPAATPPSPPAPAAAAAAPTPAPATAAPTATPAPPGVSAQPTAAASSSSALASPPSTSGATARPRAAAQTAPIDPARPPAGSPTSIEPPPATDASPVAPANAPSSAASTQAKPDTAATPAVAITTSSNQYLWVVIGVVALAIVILGVVLVRKRK